MKGFYGSRCLRAALMGLMALSSTACLDLGDKRAERDAKVGQASDGSARITVANGLAAVREFKGGNIKLWGQAPQLTWTLQTGDKISAWRLDVLNIVRGAELRIRAKDGVEQLQKRAESPRATAGVWTPALKANTQYTMTLAAPDADETKPFRFLVFADVQEAIAGVKDIYESMNLETDAEFCLISGDLTMNGTKAEFDRFEKELERSRIPCFATLGNHDIAANETDWHDRFGRGNFSFTHRGARFTLLDSASATLSPKVWPWLDEWLAAAKSQPHLVMMHIPPLDVDGARSGAFASRAEAHQLLTRLAKANVDLTIYGHVHTYASFTNAGIPAHISGGGGSIPMQLDGIGRHFLSVSVSQKDQRFRVAVIRVYPE
ncbi:MAG: metallophosphoesterase [Myxococcales bacterium]|nr:metallophosphoesterase [Myxococcales bacterium]